MSVLFDSIYLYIYACSVQGRCFFSSSIHRFIHNVVIYSYISHIFVKKNLLFFVICILLSHSFCPSKLFRTDRRQGNIRNSKVMNHTSLRQANSTYDRGTGMLSVDLLVDVQGRTLHSLYITLSKFAKLN